MSRFFGFSLITLLYVIPHTACNYQAELFLEKDKNNALHGLSIHNVSTNKIDDCLAHCLKNCLCLSFQICDDELQCQLCSSNKYISPLSLKKRKGCTNYNFGNQREKEVSNQRRDHRTVPVLNCCMTSNPCFNGGTCLPPIQQSSKMRFRCQCPHGYKGKRCKHYPTVTTLKSGTVQLQISTNINTVTESETKHFFTPFTTDETVITLEHSTHQRQLTVTKATSIKDIEPTTTQFPGTFSTAQSFVSSHPCGDVSVPLGFNSKELSVVIDSDWSRGFTGKITITAPHRIQNGWEITFLLKKAISLEVWVVTTTPSSGMMFVLKNMDYNKNLAKGSVTDVGFKATKQNENDRIPCTRAVLMWAKE